MLNTLKKSLFGSHSKRKLKEYNPLLSKINEIKHEGLTKDKALTKVAELKQRVANGEKLEKLIPEAFSLVRHAAKETIGEFHYDVQILGGLALHFGNIAEMRTGEGKTLTSTLPIFLNSLTGKGTHLVTVNDYLASRDSEWMGQIFNYLGVSVGLIVNGMNDEDRKKAYLADVTYGTNNEFGFDYLRDNMKFNVNQQVQRDHYFAIVDEVDSILIDEARTPLIISGPSEESTEKYQIINQKILGLTRASRKIDNPDRKLIAKYFDISEEKVAEKLTMLKDDSVVTSGDYSLNEKSRQIQLSEQGILLMESRLKDFLKGKSLYDIESIEYLHHINQALKAHYVFKKDVDYLIDNNQIKIVDEFTGRIMEGRRFSDGLHQAIEAKENVVIQRENQTLASITFQNYFRKYTKLSGMTGTAQTEENEFINIYGLGVVVIPTNLPMIRNDKPDVIYKNKEQKDRAILKLIQTLNRKGQPVLIGTDSIENSEHYSRLLLKSRINHEVLNAKNHEREAEIIEKAGQFGRLTISTNMAGRGTDIKLGKGVREVGGLYILGTARHESRRIDNQLRGRSGRQGDPGESRFVLSLEDDLLRIFGGDRIINIMNRLKIPDNEPIEHGLINRAIENAQQKVEAQNYSIRKHLLEYDDVMNRQREEIYEYRREIFKNEEDNTTNKSFQNLILETVSDLYDQFFTGKKMDEVDYVNWEIQFKNIFNIASPELNNLNPDQALQKSEDFIVEQIRIKRESFGVLSNDIEKHITISTIDHVWKEHLKALDYLRQGIGLRSFAQKNPLDEYKKEAFYMFKNTVRQLLIGVSQMYFRVRLREDAHLPQLKEVSKDKLELKHENVNLAQKPSQQQQEVRKKVPINRASPKIGRNEKCPCGSGKKFKNCQCSLALSARNNYSSTTP